MAMKLRIRSLESKQTLRIQVPNPCSLQRFKEIVSDAASSSSPSSISSIQVSLNGKDELHAASPQVSLHSLGVRSGDLIYYTFNPHAFSPQTLETQASVPETPIRDQKPNCSCSGGLEVVHDTSEGNKDESTGMDETPEFSGTESMDVDHGCCDVAEEKGLSVPSFLKKALSDEVFEDGNDYFLLVISIHAVLLDSGFVGFEPVSGMKTDRLHLSPARGAFTISLSYTLPELLRTVSDRGTENVVENVVLKFQNLGNFVNVYGCLAGGVNVIHQLCSDRRRFAPAIGSVWKNHNLSNGDNATDWKFDALSDKEVFEFWKAVKDGLALPLMIDICEGSGLPVPPCLTRIPTELKRKILEFLPGIHLAKMGCVSSEFRYLSMDNELWNKKFVEEFGTAVDGGVHMPSRWKVRFAKSWMLRKHSSAPNLRMWSSFSARHRRIGTGYSSVPFPRHYCMQHGLDAPYHRALQKRKLATNCKFGLGGSDV